MRKVLIIALGLASLGVLANVRPVLAESSRAACVNAALQQCNSLGGKCTTSTQYLALYNKCVDGAYAATARQSQATKNYLNNVNSSTGILSKTKNRAN
jgi:hypothetical protein